MKAPPTLKLLGYVMDIPGSLGLCIHRSAAFVLDVPGSSLVFGVIQPKKRSELQPGDSPVPFIHAWAEYKGAVYAPTTIEQMGGQLVPQNRDGYYAINGIDDVCVLSRAQLVRLDRKIGLKSALKKGGLCRGGVSLGGALLGAAGVPHKVGRDGGLLPPYVDDDWDKKTA